MSKLLLPLSAAPWLLAPLAPAQSIQWFADGASAGERFGLVVSAVGDVDGDLVPDVVVGAPNSDLGGSDSGAAYLLSGADGSTIRVIPGGAAGDSLGFSAAGAGDVDLDLVPDVILGARFADGAGPNFGAALVVSGSTGAVLHVFDGASPNGRFGEAVNRAGDVNGDGHADVIVGARLDDSSGAAVGRATVYSGADGAVLHTIYGDASADFFGRAVGAAGDVNADGFDDFLVGAPGDDDGGNLSGSMTVYSGLDGSVLHRFDGDAPGDQMGVKVAGAGDVDRDGHDDVIVGLPGSDLGGPDFGAAKLYSGATGALLYAFVGASDGAQFGSAVDGAGDVDGDGWLDLIVGARLDDTLEPEAGSASVFSGFDGSLLRRFEGQRVGDEFGDSCIGMGDIDGDSFADLLVGSFGFDGSASGAGRVIAFSGRDSIGSSICSGVPNTTGAPARLVAEGSTAAVENELTLTVLHLPVGVNGYFLTSLGTVFVAQPGGSAGNLCIGSAVIGRYAGSIQTASANGVVELGIDLTAIPQPAGSTVVAPGDTRYWQFWYRNASSSNFSDAIGISFD